MLQLTDWSPVIGCAHASPGCRDCKAIAVAKPELQALFRRENLTRDGEWTGRVHWSQQRLNQPIVNQTPTPYSVVSYGDLFFERVPVDWIDRVFAVIEETQRHPFQLQTKRATRMREYVTARYANTAPPPNLFLGVNCESSDALWRVEELLATPAAARFITAFPLMGEIDLAPALSTGKISQVFIGQKDWCPAKPEWIDRIVRDCDAAGVPYIVSNYVVDELR